MNKVDVSRRTIGINFNNGTAEVVVWSPVAKKVTVVAGNKKIELEQKKYGVWHTTTNAIRPGDNYNIQIDDKEELPDPASLSQPEGVHGASQAINVKDFKWSDEEWKNPDLEQYIIYELHTGTFTQQGTFAAVEEKLDHLKELGITAIEIMPVAQFPGERNWGYDGVFPFAVQNSYDGANGLQQLVNACHQKGLAVILDVVYNHFGPEGNYAGTFGPYFTDKYNTPWGNAVNFDDAWCDGVRNFFIENALMWFRDFHIDALRMDAVHAIKDFSPTHLLREIKQHVNELMQLTGRSHYLIVECDLNDTRFIDPLHKQGYGMDGQWIDEFHHALRVTSTGEKTGYYSDFDGIEDLAKSYEDAYVFDGQFSEHRKKFFGVKAENNPGKQFVVFSQNHDHIGNRMLGERTSQLVSFEMQKLLAGAIMVSPYLPMLFMGEEWSEPNPFLYFVSHTDPELAEAVRKGRKEEFAAFHAEGEAPDPMAEEAFLKSKLQWNIIEKEPHKTMLNYYKALIQLRKEHLVFRHLDRKSLEVSCNKEKQTLTLRRWHDHQQVICFMNFSKEQQVIELPAQPSHWSKLLDSADRQWKGQKTASGTIKNETTIELQPESIIIYESH